ncbi:uncharacterized protein LOC125162118 isoform X3 [Prionailurus viverrinus]|nr:uncharacterized protein LOC125162118 isoform X3 [Prionailurus viverrinus]
MGSMKILHFSLIDHLFLVGGVPLIEKLVFLSDLGTLDLWVQQTELGFLLDLRWCCDDPHSFRHPLVSATGRPRCPGLLSAPCGPQKAGFSSNRHHDGVWIGGKMGPSRKKQLCTFLLLEPLWISPRRCQWLAGSAHHSLPLGPGPLLQGSTLPLRSKTRKTQLRPHYCSHPTSLLCPGPMLGSQFPQISTCNLPETSAETEPLEFLRMTASR